MGTETIPTRTDATTIYATWWNILKSVLIGDVVPRNASGVATTVAGSLGSTSYPWLKLFIGAVSSVISFEESSAALLIKVGTNGGILTISPTLCSYAINGVTKFSVSDTVATLTIGTSGGVFTISPTVFKYEINGVIKFSASTSGIDRQYLGALGQQISASSGVFNTASTTAVDVTNLSVTITTTGRPVFVGIMGDLDNANYARNITNAGTVRILRDSTVVGRYQIQEASNNTSDIIPFTPWGIDAPAAGTYTYKVTALTSGATEMRIANSKLVAFEL